MGGSIGASVSAARQQWRGSPEQPTEVHVGVVAIHGAVGWRAEAPQGLPRSLYAEAQRAQWRTQHDGRWACGEREVEDDAMKLLRHRRGCHPAKRYLD
ncbi:hypothetical protein ZWY2020_017005 [Hordeum vulgare]|nr:hypothetical protein ZWY2020_017005 [Hordeum vulgare]